MFILIRERRRRAQLRKHVAAGVEVLPWTTPVLHLWARRAAPPTITVVLVPSVTPGQLVPTPLNVVADGRRPTTRPRCDSHGDHLAVSRSCTSVVMTR